MAETVILRKKSDNTVRLLRHSFQEAHQDSFTSPPAQNPESFELLENLLPVTDGVLRRRWGMTRLSATIALVASNVSFYAKDDGTKYRLIWAGLDGATRKIKTCDTAGAVQNTAVYTLTSTTIYPRSVVSRDYAYFASGSADDRAKYNGDDGAGVGVTSWGITAPTTAPAVATSGTGSLTIRAYRDYTVAYESSTTGHITDFGPFIRLNAFVNKAQVDLTSVPTGPATEGGLSTAINRRVILATSDGGSRTRLYRLGTIADNTTTTFTDNTLEADLLAKDVLFETDADGLYVGIYDNGRPPSNLLYPTFHRGRIFGISGRSLRFSKNLAEVSTSSGWEVAGRYEESWPLAYSLEIPPELHDPVGLLSDGTYLYVLGKSGIAKLAGDGPLTFRPIEIVFKHVGVASQDAIDIVYIAGAPVGAVWLSPEKQVIFSDMSTYQNLSWPIRTELDAIPAANLNNVRVRFASLNGYNLALFAIPDASNAIPVRIMALHVDGSKWYRWVLPATQAVSTLFYWINPTTTTPQIIWGNSGDTFFYFDPATGQDRTSANVAANFTAKARTAWQNFGNPLSIKQLNYVEAFSSAASDVTVDIDGASTPAKFVTPNSILSGAALGTEILGEQKVTVAGENSPDRWFRFTFNVAGTTTATDEAISGYTALAREVGHL